MIAGRWSGTRTIHHLPGPTRPSGRLDRCRDAFGDEHFDDVADLDVVVLLEADAALEPGLDFRDVVLEAPQRADLALEDDDVVAEQTGLGSPDR